MTEQMFPVNSKLYTIIRSGAKLALVFIVFIGFLCITGWAFDIGILKRILPGMASMKANTAICFLLLSAALLLYIYFEEESRWRKISILLSVVCGVVAILTLAEYLFDFHIGIDQFLFVDNETHPANFPGRMSVATCVAFMLASLSFILFFSQLPRGIIARQMAAILVLFMGLFGLVGYAFDVQMLYNIEIFSSLAINTAVCFVLLSLSVFLLDAERGLANIILNKTLGGIMLRKMLPATFLILFTIGWVANQSVKMEFFSLDYAMILVTFCSTILVGVFLMRKGRKIATLDDENNRKKAEIERMNAELNLKNAELFMLNQEKDRFLGIASHDLKNQLASMLLSLNILQDKKDISVEFLTKYLDRLNRYTHNMDRTIHNFLSINRIQRGIIEPDITRVDISALIVQIIYEYQEVAAHKGIEIDFSNNCEGEILETDRNYLGIVIDNLVSNAIKYSFKDKKIFVRLYKESDSENFIIEVEDHGQGIPEAEMPKMYKKFQKLGSKPTGGEPSTGLGLSIVKDLVKALRGSVTCESKVNKGTTFRIELAQ